MKSQHLPPFVIDANKSAATLNQLAEAIDGQSPALGIVKVLLVTPKLHKQRTNGSLHIEKARKRRLFTSDSGMFHGTDHNLKNNLLISGLYGTLFLFDGAGQSYVMALRPSEPVEHSAHPARSQRAIDGAAAVHTVAGFTDALRAARQSTGAVPELKRSNSGGLYRANSKDAVTDDLGSFIDMLRPIWTHKGADSRCKPA